MSVSAILSLLFPVKTGIMPAFAYQTTASPLSPNAEKAGTGSRWMFRRSLDEMRAKQLKSLGLSHTAESLPGG